MIIHQLVQAAILVLSIPVVATAQMPASTFDGAQWIWFSREPMPSSFNFPNGTHCFRGVLQVPEDTQVASAEMLITADNLYTFSINGTPAGEGHPSPDLWHQPKRFDVTALVTAGRNVVAVEAINTAAGPAGLLVKLAVHCADGRRVELVTNASWMCTDQEAAGWDQPGFDDRGWRVPEICGRYGAPPGVRRRRRTRAK